MSTTPEIRTLPPITCQPWCRDGEGHPHEIELRDQVCVSAWMTTDQYLEPKWEDSDGAWRPRTIEVAAERGPAHPPAVVLYRGDDDIEIHLTADEARDVAAHLIACADLAEGSAL